MPLTDRAIRNAKPKEKAYRLFDGAGLYLEVAPSGSKWWRFKYRFGGKEKRISLGVFPEVSLREARDQTQEARRLVRSGIDPSARRQEDQAALTGRTTFRALAEEWLALQASKWTPGHTGRVRRSLEADVYPWLGALPVEEIAAPAVLGVLRRIEERDAVETAHRVKQRCSMVFRYAVASGLLQRDPSADLGGALSPVRVRHHASIVEPKRIGALLRAIDGLSGAPATKAAMRLAPLVFVRPGELRSAEWAEVDLEAAEWRIPAEKMKARRPHHVPLSTQAVEILSDLRPITEGASRYVFPNRRSPLRPMSDNALTAALRNLGYSGDEMTVHGFRSMASTLLNEQGWSRDAIERQLGHAEQNSVRAAYNFADHLPERRRMMQAWADYLDELRAGAKIIRLRSVS